MSDAVSCAVCGTTAPEPPLTWSHGTGPRGDAGRGDQWLCERCTRANVRSIEGRLDEQWW